MSAGRALDEHSARPASLGRDDVLERLPLAVMKLRARWQKAAGDSSAADAVFADLVARYSEPHRRYHNLAHVEFGLGQFDLLEHLAERPEEVVVAFFFHDAVYDIGASDNEERSAELARQSCRTLGFALPVLDRIASLVEVTALDSSPVTIDELVISDIDLAVLGQDHQAFERYETLVREEYEAVPDDTFWRARKEVLRSILNRLSIFLTDEFGVRYEASARAILLRTIQRH